MTDLNCYITTFNCARTLINVDYFAANLFDALKTNLPPDLVVLCLEEIAPLGHSFLGGSLLAPYFARFNTAVNNAASQRFEGGNEYAVVLARHVGMTAIMVFARSEIEERIRWIEHAGVGVGVWDMGNKGAVGVRFGLAMEDEGDILPLTFVAAHLAPFEDKWEKRNEDWKNICKGLVFERDAMAEAMTHEREWRDGAEAEPLLASSNETEGLDDNKSGISSLFSPVSHVFFAGDLNYRTSDSSPKLDDHRQWPQVADAVSEYNDMLKQDQLTRELRNKKTLHYLDETDIKFAPTYKYSKFAQSQATNPGKRKSEGLEDAFVWAKHRMPSWCDRILYLATSPPTIHSYWALPVQPTSDHRPVSLSCSIPLAPIDKDAIANVKPPFPVRSDWKQARASARRYEFVVGLAAYLALTWEGEALLVGTIVGILGGYLAIRAMIET